MSNLKCKTRRRKIKLLLNEMVCLEGRLQPAKQTFQFLKPRPFCLFIIGVIHKLRSVTKKSLLILTNIVINQSISDF